MHRKWFVILALVLAACAPMQIGLEAETPTAGSPAATETASPGPKLTATRTPRPPTAVVGTVTPSATVPSPTPTATETSTLPPPTDTPPPTATRRPTSTSVPPSPMPTATHTVPPLGTPMVLLFQTDRLEADPFEHIVLTWATTDTRVARLHAGTLDGSGTLVWRTIALDLPPAGSLTVTIEDAAPAQLFRLEAVGAGEQVGASNTVSIQRRTCPQTYAFSFPAGRFNCAAGPLVTVSMVEQVFERGRLLRVETNEWLNPRSEPAIFVLTESGTWVGRTNTWQPGEPESDPSLVPPQGRFQPVGSFGELWRDELRDQFGWALAPEQAYSGGFQYGWAPQPGHEVGAPGWYAQDLYLRLSNGDVARLVWGSRFTGQTWELLPQ